MLGYNGKILYVNLNAQKSEIKDLDLKIAEDYVGGVGLSAKLTYDLLSEEDYYKLRKDPFSSLNPLIFATGPLTGSIMPSSSRYSITAISPLTGIWGESTSGGYFPISFRKCGFDAIVLIGESKEPVYIYINNGEIQIKDAKKIWGKDTRDTMESIKNELGNEKVRITCIGKAGENLVKYACVINDEGRASGRCGLGAIMGKKSLKALAIKGNKPIEYSDKQTMINQRKGALSAINRSFAAAFWNHYGTLNYTDMGMVLGDVPAKYFTTTEFVAENLTGRALKEKYPVLNYFCAGCTIGCGRTTIAEIDGVEIEIDGPEYETTAAFGPMCDILHFEPIIKANHLCNLNGVDTISSGVSISFLIYLCENKIGVEKISEYLKDIELEEIKWGNEETVLKLLKKIINREGIGNILADGVKIMAEKFGVDPELAAHVKGLEIPMHEPRAYVGQALSYMTCCCGANHNKGDFFNIDGDAASYRRMRKGDRFSVDGRELSVMLYQDLTNLYDSACVCQFPHINIPILTKFFKASTGFNSWGNKKKLFMAGERANNLKRLISCKLGITRNDDHLPKIVVEPFEGGGCAGIRLDLENNLKKYYNHRGWDWETGAPTKEKLKELGIQ
jgi:aldehyde:ferredoxin oxidoreductase